MKKSVFRILICVLILSLALPIVPNHVLAEGDTPPMSVPSVPDLEHVDILPERLEPDHYLLQEHAYPPEPSEMFPGEAQITEPREYIPPSPEIIALTRQRVQSFDCSTVTEVPQTECEALVALYNSTNGAGWTTSTNWLITNTVGNWYGVTVSNGHVVRIEIRNNLLSGPLPAALSNLPNLGYFVLYGNQLTGSVPSELSVLTSLYWISIGGNLLSGPIPAVFSSLTNLEFLGLSNNQFTGPIPEGLQALSKLSVLFLDHNQLEGLIPDSLGYLSNLQSLYLGYNNLTGSIPSSLGNLTKLGYLNLENNELSGSIPSSLGNLILLDRISLYSNQFSGPIPPELGSLTNLRYLHLYDNQLSGPIPPDIGNLVNLISIDLSDNMLSGNVPASFTNLVNLCVTGNQDPPCYGMYDTDLGYNRLNVPAPEPPASFLDLKDPDWYLTQAVEEEIPGDTGGTVISNDGNTEVAIPAGAAEGTLTILFAPQPNPNEGFGVLNFAGNSFELTASDELGPVESFAQPLTLTLQYDQASLGVIPEDTLILYYWDTDQLAWLDAASTCAGGTYTRNLDEDWLSLPICHLSEFALLGDSFDLFLPSIRR